MWLQLLFIFSIISFLTSWLLLKLVQNIKCGNFLIVFFSTFFIFIILAITQIKMCLLVFGKKVVKVEYDFRVLNSNNEYLLRNGEPFFSKEEIAACVYDTSIIHAEVDAAVIKYSNNNIFGMSFRADDLNNIPDHSLPVTPERALQLIEEQTAIKGLTLKQADELINKVPVNNNKVNDTTQVFDLFKDLRSKMYCTSNLVNTIKQYFPRPFTASPSSNTNAGLP
jgi:hypothetical protein